MAIKLGEELEMSRTLGILNCALQVWPSIGNVLRSTCTASSQVWILDYDNGQSGIRGQSLWESWLLDSELASMI